MSEQPKFQFELGATLVRWAEGEMQPVGVWSGVAPGDGKLLQWVESDRLTPAGGWSRDR